MTAHTSTARLEARISADLHSMLKRAAELQGHTMTDFVVTAVQDAAHERAAFESDSEALNRYLREQAIQDVRRRVAT